MSVEVPIGPEGIRLGQFLKYAGAVESGGEAKSVLEAGEVTVNGRVETRRGAQLGPGDEVSLAGRRWRLT
ncbi:MAG: RNA-binding S4 domain-containing protein [Frankiales bacterium]|nr:RNA-binding S4 domain-containing protein [Frankiales bacterium]